MTYTRYLTSISPDDARALLLRAGLTPLTVVTLHEEVIATVEPVLDGQRVVLDQASSVSLKLSNVKCVMTMFSSKNNRVHFRVLKGADHV